MHRARSTGPRAPACPGAATLHKGAITETAVQTQFGWHVIRLDDTREAQFLAFDDVKAQLIQRLEQLQLQQYQEQLRQAARTD